MLDLYSEITTKRGWKSLQARHKGNRKDIIENNIKYKKKFVAIANEIIKGVN